VEGGVDRVVPLPSIPPGPDAGIRLPAPVPALSPAPNPHAGHFGAHGRVCAEPGRGVTNAIAIASFVVASISVTYSTDKSFHSELADDDEGEVT
jgi:hypothetical protein